MGKIKFISILAVIVLIVGISSSIFVYLNRINAQQISVNGKEYTINQLFEISEVRSLEGESGIALDVLMIEIGAANPEESEYTIIGADGYQKTVIWENMSNGIMTKDRESIFSDLPEAFSVKEIIEIKVE